MKRFSQTVVQIKNADGDFEPIAALRGMSSYECAVQNGFEGTEDDWLEMMIGDGWVGKYQDLENKKANKSDVYTSEQTDELLQGVMEDVDYLKSKTGRLSALDDDGAYKYIKLTEHIHADPEDIFEGPAAMSPNREYMCHVDSSNTMTLYRVADMSVIGTVSNIAESNSIIIMDDDFIITCTAVYSSKYSFSTGAYKFFKYSDNLLEEISNPPTIPGRLISTRSRFAITPNASSSNYFWFWIEEATGSGVYTVSKKIYMLNKNTMAFSVFDQFTLDERNYSWYKTFELCQDGDDAIILFAYYYHGDYTHLAKSICVCAKRITADGTEDILFDVANESSTLYGSIDQASLIPSPSVIGFDPIAEQVVVSGFVKESATNYYRRIISVYPFGSTTLNMSTNNSSVSCSYISGSESISSGIIGAIYGIRDDVIYTDGGLYTLSTLENVKATLPVYRTPNLGSNVYQTQYTNSYGWALAEPLVGRIFLGTAGAFVLGRRVIMGGLTRDE